MWLSNRKQEEIEANNSCDLTIYSHIVRGFLHATQSNHSLRTLDLCVQLAVKFSTAKVSTAIVSHNLFLKTTFDVIGYFVTRMPRRPGRERRGDPCLTNESTRFRRPIRGRIARRIETIGFLFRGK